MKLTIIILTVFLSFYSFNLQGRGEREDINKKISMDFKNTELSKVIRLIVKTTNLNINFIMKTKANSKITINLTGVKGPKAFDLVLKKKNLKKEKCGNIILITPKETISKKKCSKSILRKRFHGRKESFIIYNAHIADLLELISDVTNTNIITSSDLKGRLSMRFMRIKIDKILELILKIKNLKKEVFGNVTLISNAKIGFEAIEKKSYQSILKKKYKKEKISLSFKGVDIHDVLKLLLDTKQKNLVLTKEVSGKIYLYLKDIKKDKALDLILRSKGLAMKIEGDSIFIAPLSKIFGKSEKVDTNYVFKIQNINFNTFKFFTVLLKRIFRVSEIINLSGANASALEDDDLKKLNLIGAMYSKTENFILLQTPLGRVYILKVGDTIGKNHVIIRIPENIRNPVFFVENITKNLSRAIKIGYKYKQK